MVVLCKTLLFTRCATFPSIFYLLKRLAWSFLSRTRLSQLEVLLWTGKQYLGCFWKSDKIFLLKSRSASAISFAAAGREDHGSRVFFLKWDFSHNNNQIQKSLLWSSFDISSKCSVCRTFQKKKNHHLNSISLLYVIIIIMLICHWRQPGSVGSIQSLHRGFLLLHLCPLSGDCSKYQHSYHID